MDTAIPPGHRRILKKGRLYHTLRKSNFSKGKRRLEYRFQTAVWLDVVSFDAATKTTASVFDSCIFLSSDTQMNRILRTGSGTITAADALGTVGCFHWVNAHFAGFGAQAAIYTLIFVHPQAVQRCSIKQSVGSAQRADVLAKWPVNENG